jgi:hypothetical protein
VAIVPQSIARLHARRDLTYRPITDAPTTDIALAWVADDRALDPLERAAVQDFIGIVRGRTARSSRGSADTPAAERGGKSTDGKGAKSTTRAKGAKGVKAAKPGTSAKSGKSGKSAAAAPGAKIARAAKSSGKKSSAGGGSARRSGSSSGSGSKRQAGKGKRR